MNRHIHVADSWISLQHAANYCAARQRSRHRSVRPPTTGMVSRRHHPLYQSCIDRGTSSTRIRSGRLCRRHGCVSPTPGPTFQSISLLICTTMKSHLCLTYLFLPKLPPFGDDHLSDPWFDEECRRLKRDVRRLEQLARSGASTDNTSACIQDVANNGHCYVANVLDGED